MISMAYADEILNFLEINFCASIVLRGFGLCLYFLFFATSITLALPES